MADTIIVRSTSGVLFEFDVPTTALAKERLDQQIAKGDLSIVPRESVEWVTRPDGSMVLVDVAPAVPADAEPAEDPTPAPKAKQGRKGKPAVEVTPDVAPVTAAVSEFADAVRAEDDGGEWSGNTPVIES